MYTIAKFSILDDVLLERMVHPASSLMNADLMDSAARMYLYNRTGYVVVYNDTGKPVICFGACHDVPEIPATLELATL